MSERQAEPIVEQIRIVRSHQLVELERRPQSEDDATGSHLGNSGIGRFPGRCGCPINLLFTSRRNVSQPPERGPEISIACALEYRVEMRLPYTRSN